MPRPRPCDAEIAQPRSRGRLIALVFAGVVLVLVRVLSPEALFVILRDGPISLGIIVAASGLGLWVVRLLGLHDAPVRWQLLLSVALGMGALSLLILALGILGLLDRLFWSVLLVLFALAGLPRWWRLLAQSRAGMPGDSGSRAQISAAPSSAGSQLSPWLWLLAVGFAALALLGATMPPGVLWPAEGNGYDVLEYHFGAPRDFLDAGRIAYLPHNIYANFPLNVEMLYLLTMVLHGDAIDAVYTAKLLNAMTAFLAVGGVWLVGRECGRGTGLFAGLLAASCPFLVYLSGVAYVENAMVFYAAMAMATFVRARRDERREGRWMLVCGLLSGLACGCKYTAVVAVAAPLGLAVVLTVLRRRPLRLRMSVVFVVGCLLTFGPWLVKNTVATGNPVFPLAHEVIGARDGVWSDDRAAMWREGHLPDEKHRPFAARCGRLWNEVISTRMFGPVVGFGLFFGVFLLWASWRRPTSFSMALDDPPGNDGRRGDWRTVSPCPELKAAALACHLAAGCMIVVGLAAWLFTTHLVGRFSIVVLVPCAVLTGLAGQAGSSRDRRPAQYAILAAIAAFNLWMSWSLFSSPTASIYRPDARFIKMRAFGLTQLMTEGEFPGYAHVPRLNELSAEGYKALVVADARRFYLDAGADYCVVFNDNPFSEAAADLSPDDLIRWLRKRHYSFVYVDWGEMKRLRTTYGFWPSLTIELFEQLVEAGLRPVESFKWKPEAEIAYSTLFALPSDRGTSGAITPQ